MTPRFETTQKQEQTLAIAVHIGAIFFPIVAPIIGLAVSKPDSFLRSHSLFRLKREIITMVIAAVFTVGYILWSIPGWVHHFQTGFKDFDLIGFLIRSVIVWLIGWLYGVWNTAEGIWLAIKALNGKWPKGATVPELTEKA